MKKTMLVFAAFAMMFTVANAEEAPKAAEAAAPAAPAAEAAPAAAPQKVKMKISAKIKGDKVVTKVGITHDMLTYDMAKKKGKEANFITHVTATVGDKVVYDVSTSQFLSKNPLFKFQFKSDGIKKGDMLKITYSQLKGEVFYAEKKIK